MNAWWPKHAIQRVKMHEGNVTCTWCSQMLNMKSSKPSNQIQPQQRNPTMTINNNDVKLTSYQ